MNWSENLKTKNNFENGFEIIDNINTLRLKKNYFKRYPDILVIGKIRLYIFCWKTKLIVNIWCYKRYKISLFISLIT